MGEEEKEKAEVGKPVRKTRNEERAAYWQLYKARVDDYGSFVSSGEPYHELIQKARGLPSVSVEGGREEVAEARVV